MARSKRKNMQALSGLLFLVVACLVAVAVVNIKHHDILSGNTANRMVVCSSYATASVPMAHQVQGQDKPQQAMPQ